MKAARYIGPPYDQGIVIDGLRHALRPADFSDADRDAFIERYPEFAEWWETAEDDENLTDPDPEPTTSKKSTRKPK